MTKIQKLMSGLIYEKYCVNKHQCKYCGKSMSIMELNLHESKHIISKFNSPKTKEIK